MKGSVFIFFVFCVLQVINCHDVTQQSETFEAQLNQTLARSYSTLTSIRSTFVLNQVLPRLKPRYKEIIDQNNEQMVEELRAHYDNLKKTSLETGVLPNMDENLIELKVFEIQPKYLDSIAKSFLDIVRSTPDITPEAKAVISNKVPIVLKNTKALLLEPFKNEIKSHVNEWRTLDIFKLETAGEKHIPTSPEQQKLISDIRKRMNSIYVNYTSFTDLHFEALENALKPYEYLFIDDNPRQNDL